MKGDLDRARGVIAAMRASAIDLDRTVNLMRASSTLFDTRAVGQIETMRDRCNALAKALEADVDNAVRIAPVRGAT